jgi:SAM-dependent methyltransferase
MADPPKPVASHYDEIAASYHEMYEARLDDVAVPYPANAFRMKMLVDSFAAKGLRSVIEVGVGEGTPLVALGDEGLDVWGFDLSRPMVERARARMDERGFDPDHVFWGDIRDPGSYSEALGDRIFDGAIAMGVMPHVEDDDRALGNIAALVRPGGSVFIEFRNKLFSLFTANRLTLEFVLDDLLDGVAPELKRAVEEELRPRLRMDMPPHQPGFDDILAKFHNPFEVPALFERCGFESLRLLWYHYHPAMPYLEASDPQLFRDQSLALEGETSGWRGYFLCSAFVVEAVKSET